MTKKLWKLPTVWILTGEYWMGTQKSFWKTPRPREHKLYVSSRKWRQGSDGGPCCSTVLALNCSRRWEIVRFFFSLSQRLSKKKRNTHIGFNVAADGRSHFAWLLAERRHLFDTPVCLTTFSQRAFEGAGQRNYLSTDKDIHQVIFNPRTFGLRTLHFSTLHTFVWIISRRVRCEVVNGWQDLISTGVLCCSCQRCKSHLTDSGVMVDMLKTRQCLLGVRTFLSVTSRLWSFFLYILRKHIRTVSVLFMCEQLLFRDMALNFHAGVWRGSRHLCGNIPNLLDVNKAASGFLFHV